MNKKTGILLINLGTPSHPTPQAIRRFLAEFLSDPRIISMPRVLWRCLLHGIILRTRPRRLAKRYQSIWTEHGSPILDYSQGLADKLQLKLGLEDFTVVLGMRYGTPSLRDAMNKLTDCDAIIVLPLYPQNSATTTASAFDKIADNLKTINALPELFFVNSYATYPGYITALTKQIEQHWATHSPAEKLVFSFHGLPQKNIQAGDPYYQEVQNTVQLIAKALHLTENDWVLTFQSRFGSAQWLAPATDTTLKQLAQQGVRSVDIVCPGFAADCLETLEEINVEHRALFLKAGGEQFTYIPALNDSELHANMLLSLIQNTSEKMHNTLINHHIKPSKQMHLNLEMDANPTS
jgi:protoporphyrin/coproporphyrin ferrochelatase